jgi:hypothetical protein
MNATPEYENSLQRARALANLRAFRSRWLMLDARAKRIMQHGGVAVSVRTDATIAKEAYFRALGDAVRAGL